MSAQTHSACGVIHPTPVGDLGHVCSDGRVLACDGTLLSTHLLERWDERMPVDAVAPEVAWARGEDVHHPEVYNWFTHYKRHADRVRVYHSPDEWIAIMPVCDDTAVTAMRWDSAAGAIQRYTAVYGPHGGEGR